MANAFQQASFFSTLRDIDKQKSDKRLEEKRFGLQERQVAGSERRQEFVESEADRTQRAGEAKAERERATRTIQATIENAGRSLAQLSLETGQNSSELKFTQEMNTQLDMLSESADALGLFSKAEVQQMLQSSIDSELERSLGASSVGVRNVQDRQGNIISEADAQRQIASGQATVADFTIAPTQAETGGAGAFRTKVGTAEQQNIRNAAVQVSSIGRSLLSAKESLKSNPASAAFVGEAAQFADNTANNLINLVSQATQLGLRDVDQQGVDEDISRLRKSLKGLAGPVAQFNSALIDASYAKALILNGARPTDVDVKKAYESLTGGSNDPTIIIESFDRANAELVQVVRDRAKLAGMDLGDFFEEAPQAGGGVDAIAVGSSVFQNGIEFVKQPDGTFRQKGN